MRILFFVEPARFRRNALFLAPHVAWVAGLMRSTSGGDAEFALASSAPLCRQLREAHGPWSNLATYVLEPDAACEEGGEARADYLRGLYGDGSGPSRLRHALDKVRAEFQPDLVLLTSQNAFAERALAGLPALRIEQAPLPRAGQPTRMAFDPGGHQCRAMLETHASQIRAFAADPSVRAAAAVVLDALGPALVRHSPLGPAAREALASVSKSAPVALLALQPPDWVSFEGAIGIQDPAHLLLRWAARLPPGWLGVPTYHPDWRLSPAVECSLAGACARLRFLPGSLAQGSTEALLPAARGLVTVSSSAAMTAVLLGRPAVVVGHSPFRSWGATSVQALAEAEAWPLEERLATLAFLCHRYACLNAQVLEQPGVFLSLARAVAGAADPAQWMLDPAGGTPDRLLRCFNL